MRRSVHAACHARTVGARIVLTSVNVRPTGRAQTAAYTRVPVAIVPLREVPAFMDLTPASVNQVCSI